MDLKLKNKVILITGGSKGIGLALGKYLANEGAKVSICARNEAEVAAAVEQIKALGTDAYGAAVDVTDQESISQWVSDSARTLGGIDGYIANVSAGGADVEESGWRRNFETDILATWKIVETLLPYLEKSEIPSIVNISSTAALEAFAGAVPFGAMKAAMLNYFGNLANVLAPQHIRVNSVSPGPVFIKDGAWDQIKQAMPEVYESTVAAIPMGRMATAEEVCAQVALLLSPVSSFTTGTNVVIDGGFTKRIQY
ncbi:SDR family oxidoreductase [Aestuariicella hydrocarbonica]|uniref:SDR family oxidoreductase n=1 Tax=Pseudomaricurvus hydrocarbonicus TaxID=1470433 RepID=A0A9E5JY89_9GAMM|nr:SDR family oxidoreductase [Aestuariicella hydrocarbonica]NHO66851.1 SDR family oxidoreductase [Aestuariicella hydrocarbonica]